MKNFLIGVGVITLIYLVISVVTSVQAYSIHKEAVEAYKKLKPEEFCKTKLYEIWSLPRWYRIKECIKIGFVPILHISALKISLTRRSLLLTQLIKTYSEDTVME